MAFFEGVTAGGTTAEQAAVQKALSAGYGTDSATYVNGRAMIPENLETSTVNVVRALKDDCKIVNALKKEPSASTIHEFNRRTEHGDHRFLSVPEGGSSLETSQALEREVLAMKYLQTKRSVTKQMEVVRTFENALASEKLAGIETIVKGTENMCIHGDADIVPTEFDGLLKQIKANPNAYKCDARGKSLGALGEGVLDDVAREVWERGGDLKRALFPAVLAKDFKALFAERERYIMNNPLDQLSFGLHPYVTAIGSTIALSGDGAGADKFFRVKGRVSAAGSVSQRPGKPTIAVSKVASQAGSKFGTGDAGVYKYTVHAVNAYGISEGSDCKACDALTAAGEGVTVTITKGAGAEPTGYIICRSNKGGDDVMEMAQVAAAADGGKATFTDLNEELPGTASVIFLSEGRVEPILTLSQLLPVSTYPLYPTDKAETPFLVLFFGALENRAPEWCALLNNLAYTGGLY